MNDHGKEADDMGTLVEISSHPRFKPADDLTAEAAAASARIAAMCSPEAQARRDAEAATFVFNNGREVYEETIATVPVAPPPPPAREESVYLSCAETAKLVRAALKKAFPGIKFSVVSHVYSMGASIRVKWHAGPEPADVNKVARAFAGATFDGMTDSTVPYTHWLLPDGSVVLASNGGGTFGGEKINTPKPHPDAKKVHFGANFVFCDRHWEREPDLPTVGEPAAEPRECMVCGKPTTEVFWCPCDLSHPICAGNHADIVPRLDCAHIWDGRGHYTTRTGRS